MLRCSAGERRFKSISGPTKLAPVRLEIDAKMLGAGMDEGLEVEMLAEGETAVISLTKNQPCRVCRSPSSGVARDGNSD